MEEGRRTKALLRTRTVFVCARRCCLPAHAARKIKTAIAPERIQATLDEKGKGGEITVAAPEAPARAQIIDLMQALKQSIEKAKPKQKAAPAQRKRKTASSDS